MTDTLFEYDHLLMHAEYRTPDIHSHLAVHLIVGLGSGLHCTVVDENFDTDAVFIASDVSHTVYSDSGEMLVFLFDSASHYASEIDLMYLNGNRYFCLTAEHAEGIRILWTETGNSIREADKAILEYLDLSKSREKQMV